MNFKLSLNNGHDFHDAETPGFYLFFTCLRLSKSLSVKWKMGQQGIQRTELSLLQDNGSLVLDPVDGTTGQ